MRFIWMSKSNSIPSSFFIHLFFHFSILFLSCIFIPFRYIMIKLELLYIWIEHVKVKEIYFVPITCISFFFFFFYMLFMFIPISWIKIKKISYDKLKFRSTIVSAIKIILNILEAFTLFEFNHEVERIQLKNLLKK